MRRLATFFMVVVMSLLVVTIFPAQAQDNTLLSVLEKQADLSTLVTAIKAAGLDATMGEMATPVTVFAPSNEAFADLPDSTLQALLSNKADLTQLLTYHVIGQPVTSDTISTTGQVVKTLEGDSFTVTNTGIGKTLVGGAVVTQANIAAGSSIIHIIDTVLVPAALRGKLDSPRIRTAYNRELGRAFIEDLLGAANLQDAETVANRIMDTDYIQHNPLVDQGRKGLLGFLTAMPSFFSDTRFTLKDVIADENSVVARWVWSGKHTGNFLSYEATNKEFNMGVIDIWTVKDGVLHEHWDELGWSYALSQLGIYQFPPAPIGPVKGYPTTN